MLKDYIVLDKILNTINMKKQISNQKFENAVTFTIMAIVALVYVVGMVTYLIKMI